MITVIYFVRLAANNLRRGGQRVLVALLCITFGITALVAMTNIARSIESSLLVEPAQLVGGDLSMMRTAEDSIRLSMWTSSKRFSRVVRSAATH